MTTQTINAKRLVNRFNKYVDYRKEVERSGSSFTEQMAKLASEKTSERDGRVGDDRHSGHLARAGRRYAPPKLATPKPIHLTQAKRLASYAPTIQEAAIKNNVPVELICGVILQESGGNPNAVSPAGAKGLMQLMPQTAKRFGVKDSLDPAQNIHGGTKYLRWLLDRFDGNIELALAGYNAGEAAVEKHGNKIPPYRETQAYVPNVLGYTQSMIDILYAQNLTAELPAHARRA